jgi:hypothetical protein
MGCQNSTRVEAEHVSLNLPAAPAGQAKLRFLTDSTAVSGFNWSYVCDQHPPISTLFKSGLGRAFREVPANEKVLQPKAARRKQ